MARKHKPPLGLAFDLARLGFEAWMVIGVVRKARVCIVTPGNELLRNFFDQEATAKVARVTYLFPADLADSAKYQKPARESWPIFPKSLDARPRRAWRALAWRCGLASLSRRLTKPT